ncbi:hypothetical protein SAMN05192529_10294 [Arachidicoccus rhizosphaerae]|uniref:Uncharacterized protein n=1 Tax=Arachidicoccus rhizosphaerae TaxID=551991 RepID=A0A1H3W592_9BACT|nr:hypothetical protein [Arachidicoccus rhizosphaerae]SDZ81512.1 hypothetical protein SAMN05192529_10294 [Arachidicoccus rhizosphaerae]
MNNIEINKLEDLRDRVLKLSIAGINTDVKMSEVLNVPKTEIWDAAVAIQKEKDWYILDSTFGGKIISLKPDREDVQSFLDNGGFSEQEYSKKIEQEELMSILSKMQDNNDRISVSVADMRYPYFRLRKIIKLLKGNDLIKPITLNKVSEIYEISDKGHIALNNNSFSSNQINIDMSRHNKFEGPTIYTEGDVKGDINQDNSKKND